MVSGSHVCLVSGSHVCLVRGSHVCLVSGSHVWLVVAILVNGSHACFVVVSGSHVWLVVAMSFRLGVATHARSHARTHTRTYTHIHTHTHTHTHTHKCALQVFAFTVFFPEEVMSVGKRKEILRSFYKKVIGTYFSSPVEGSETGWYISAVCKTVFPIRPPPHLSLLFIKPRSNWSS